MPFSASELTDLQVATDFAYTTQQKTDTIKLRYRPDRITRRFLVQLQELNKSSIESEDEEGNKRQLDRLVCHLVAWWDVGGTNLDDPDTLYGLSWDVEEAVLNHIMEHRKESRLGESQRETAKPITSPGISRPMARKTSSRKR